MKPVYHANFKLGILGGGQLGRMLLQEAPNLDIRVHILDPDQHAPCAQLAHRFVQGSFADYDTVMAFGRQVDVLTVEIEHVNTQALRDLRDLGVVVNPSPEVLETVQDKGLQKQFYRAHNLPTAPFELYANREELLQANPKLPFVHKLRKGGYDGRGVNIVRTAEQLTQTFQEPSVREDLCDIEREISVVVARNARGEVAVFPPVALEYNPTANLVEMLVCPSGLDSNTEQRAINLAQEVCEKLQVVGLLAVELFHAKNGEIWVNEVAPRPHNSGHHTIEANITSQYGQHLRAVLNLPLGNTDLRTPAAMINLLGAEGHSGPVRYRGLEDLLKEPGIYVHLYGKTDTRPFRKMGHVTILGATRDEAISRARAIRNVIRVESET